MGLLNYPICHAWVNVQKSSLTVSWRPNTQHEGPNTQHEGLICNTQQILGITQNCHYPERH
jgi:hypothetical protein